MTIQISSVNTLIIYFEERICEEVLDQVQRAYRLLKDIEGIIDITPSYHSLLIEYDIGLYDYKSIQKQIRHHLSKQNPNHKDKKGKLIKIPTLYSEAVGIDLARVAKLNALTIQEVIEIHTQTIYRVYAIGFMLGFAYLAKVDKQIVTPRLATPRAKVPKGSIAIAEHQTAIYPKDSAGGWNIIGQTKFDDFTQFEVGDSVQFVSIG